MAESQAVVSPSRLPSPALSPVKKEQVLARAWNTTDISIATVRLLASCRPFARSKLMLQAMVRATSW